MSKMIHDELREFLFRKVKEYNQPSFIVHDPISVPHRFSKLQDIEMAGFFSAIFAWGNRRTIINKANQLMQRMDNAPHDFALNHTAQDLKKLFGFTHRTFNDTDLLYFIEFFKHHYQQHDSLEEAFAQYLLPGDDNIENALKGFYNYFFSLADVPARTRKHVATPARGSACKRLCMFLRWMVRNDDCGVDFGLWKKISPAQLILPLDVHVARVAYNLKLLPSQKSGWHEAVSLTKILRQYAPDDPCIFDYALFALGVNERF